MHIYISTLSHSVSSLTRRRCAAGTALAERARLRSWGWYYQSFGSRFPKLVASSTSIILNGTSDAWPMRALLYLIGGSPARPSHASSALPWRRREGPVPGETQIRRDLHYSQGVLYKIFKKKSQKSQICLFF